jgi:hypothetical protein
MARRDDSPAEMLIDFEIKIAVHAGTDLELVGSPHRGDSASPMKIDLESARIFVGPGRRICANTSTALRRSSKGRCGRFP